MNAWKPLLLFAATAGASAGTLAGTTGLDASFGNNGIVLIGPTPTTGVKMNRISALVIDADGRIVIGGYVWGSEDVLPKPAVGRLDAEGNWDTSFADNGLFVLSNDSPAAPYGGRIDQVGLFSDGSVLAAGSSHQPGGYYYSCTVLIKLTTLGVPDTGFAPEHSGSYCFDFAPPMQNWYVTYHWDDIKVDSDDSFFLTSPTTNLSDLRSAVAHLDSTGTLVDIYGTNGIAAVSDGVVATNRLEILPDHSVVAVGISGTINNLGLGASQLDINGDVETGYGVLGIASTDLQGPASIGIPDATTDSQHRLLISSYSHVPGYDDSPFRLARLTSAGTVDMTFNGNGQQSGPPGVAVLTLSSNPSNDGIRGATPLPDGYILVVGQNAKVADSDGMSNISLARLRDDAAWDASYGDTAHPGWASLNIGGKSDSYGGPGSPPVEARDGRILVAIGATDANDHACIGLLRIVPDRLLDAGFDAPTPMPTCPQ